MGTPQEVKTKLLSRLKALRLPGFREGFEDLARKAVEEDLSYEQYLLELTYRECDERSARKIERLLRDSRLPLEKTLRVFDQQRLSTKAARQVRSLLDGSFLDRRENVLAFGNSGAGKTHLLCALGQELIRQGERAVYFSPCSLLVQELLVGKRDLKLSRVLKRLSKYDAVIIDDIGYVQQSRDGNDRVKRTHLRGERSRKTDPPG